MRFDRSSLKSLARPLNVVILTVIITIAATLLYCGELIMGKGYELFLRAMEPEKTRSDGIKWATSSNFVQIYGQNGEEVAAKFFMMSGCCGRTRPTFVTIVKEEFKKPKRWFDENKSYRQVGNVSYPLYRSDIVCRITRNCTNVVYFAPTHGFKVTAVNFDEDGLKRLQRFVRTFEVSQ